MIKFEFEKKNKLACYWSIILWGTCLTFQHFRIQRWNFWLQIPSPEDMGMNQTVKVRSKSFLRNYTIENDKVETLAAWCVAISDIMTTMVKELVKAFRKIAGICDQNDTRTNSYSSISVAKFGMCPKRYDVPNTLLFFRTRTVTCWAQAFVRRISNQWKVNTTVWYLNKYNLYYIILNDL